MENKPLNGEKTHPLSAHAKSVLVRMTQGPIPRQEINPGVVNRFLREDLATIVNMESPYKTVKGMVQHLVITESGRKAAKS